MSRPKFGFSKPAYVPAGAPVVIPTNLNHRIPEIGSGEDPLPLSAGSGVYAGKLTNHPGASEYSDIVLNSMDQLNGFGPGAQETVLLGSSGGRWSASVAGAQIALELLLITPGLTVGTPLTPETLSGPGMVYLLGDGAGFEFTPVFWTEAVASPGTYSATMRLVDLRASTQSVLPSGSFSFDFSVPAQVPEPGTNTLLGLGLMATVLVARIRRLM